MIGPFTPGLIADTDIALELAELGVILLMFGVGIQFSIRELLAVRSIAIPGADPPDDRLRDCSGCGSGPPSVGAWAAGSCSAWRCRSRAPSCSCAR